MNGSNDNGSADNAVDASSFASILAGVKRMRNQFGGDATEDSSNIQISQPEPDSEPAPKRVQLGTSKDNIGTETSSPYIFSDKERQERSRDNPVINPRINRTTLHVATAEAIGPNLHANIAPINVETSSSSLPVSSVRDSLPVRRVLAPSEILVNRSQIGNPLLKESLMRITPWRQDNDILSDYYISPMLQILFLSLKYHKLKPEYVWTRLKKLNGGSSSVNVNRNDKVLRVLLVVNDVDSHQDLVRDLSGFCIRNDLSLVIASSFEEAGNYVVQAKKSYDAPVKSKGGIRGMRGLDYNSSVLEAMTGIQRINKTDVSNLLANFKSVKEIILQGAHEDSESRLGMIGGLGAAKIRNLRRVFSEPFIYNKQYEKLSEIEKNGEDQEDQKNLNHLQEIDFDSDNFDDSD
ncbi:ssDNA endonuclease and repair protein [Scheffersomyces stipitis CBS 6054]|uniref:SsDNA endonuclease and repair protein n=1 Tax=Scheffersomyces stipitis (strain ATCC 58785 / CBS 6054 / NBRC 10063 / NRRL Y-11545) TaxID=322104 RepID=A3GFT8_PICST|nr:ssDNA endonuclease and repair protein [Scheffersomyces stipitis CBS 6054]EAZ63402.2 ssDNA endonuclease and repair protein [Scheffersomyces stipitis CBS 6054]KAG2735232.1 hypothetical protein G9P44_001446 [Scheffersomyces stipitis]